MKNKINEDQLLPAMMGTEHELSITFEPRKKIILDEFDINYFDKKNNEDGYYQNSNDELLYDSVTEGTIADINISAPTIKVLSNGGVLSHIYGRPMEIATPECKDPKELLTYSLASRLLIKKWIKDYISQNSSTIRSISINERVVDSIGNTWGEHDNYSLLPEESGYGVLQSVTPPLIWLHLLTRGVVTGAGAVKGSGGRCWSLSQKISTVINIHDKKWGSTGMWGDDERLEIRCSDKNVSEWAHLVRIGSAALVLALTRTGFDIEKLGIQEDLYEINKISDYDAVNTSKTGQVKLTYEAKIAVSIQKILAEASLEMLDKYGSPSFVYKQIAHKWLGFAEKLEKASLIDQPLDLTQFMESDWASKFYTIQSKIKSDTDKGYSRVPHDYCARAQDIMYDRISFESPISGAKVYEVEGPGFKLNDKISSRRIANKNDINFSMGNTPDLSRSESRTKFINFLIETGCAIMSFDWSCITWEDNTGTIHERHF